MCDYIDRDKAIMAITSIASEVAKNVPYDAEWFGRLAERQVEIISVIMQEQTIDAEPVRHGRWIEDSNDKWRCSECGIGNMYAYSWDNDVGRKLQDYFCPHCGAKMDLEE